MAIRRTSCTGRWSDGHRRVLRGGRNQFPESGDWALSGVPNRRDALEPTYSVPDSIRPSIEEAWEELRIEILNDWSAVSMMPWAWWIFDSPEPRDLRVSQPEQLHRLGLGLITEEEFASRQVQDLHICFCSPLPPEKR